MFDYQRKQTELQQKIDFFNELLTKLPVQTFLPKVEKLKKSDVLPALFTEKVTELSCFAIRATLFAGKEVSDRINELMDIVNNGYVMNSAVASDEPAQTVVAMKFFQDYQSKVNEIISAVKRELQEFSVLCSRPKRKTKTQKQPMTKQK